MESKLGGLWAVQRGAEDEWVWAARPSRSVGVAVLRGILTSECALVSFWDLPKQQFPYFLRLWEWC